MISFASHIEQKNGYTLVSFKYEQSEESAESVSCLAVIRMPASEEINIFSDGNGPINAFVEGLRNQLENNFT